MATKVVHTVQAVEALKGKLAEGGYTVLDAEPEPES